MPDDISKRDVAITAAVIVILLASVVSWLIYKQHKTTPAQDVTKIALAGAYKGWQADNSSLPGLMFYYPPSWADVPSSSICTGAKLVTLTPYTNEIAAAKTGPQYYVEIEEYGTQNANCKADGTNFSGVTFSSISSSDQLKTGVFKKDWLTFFTGGNTTYATTKADTAIVTSDEYSGPQTAFKNTGTLTYKGSTYQVSVVTSTTETQTEEPSNISISSFKSTQLYKDTVNIFNSIQPN